MCWPMFSPKSIASEIHPWDVPERLFASGHFPANGCCLFIWVVQLKGIVCKEIILTN